MIKLSNILLCSTFFRGHNELDDPTMTNPEMYEVINKRSSVPDLYKEKLIQDGVATESEITGWENDCENILEEHLKGSDAKVEPAWSPFQGNWSGIQQPDLNAVTLWDTGMKILIHLNELEGNFARG